MRLEAPYRMASAPVFDIALEVGGGTSGRDVQRRFDLRSAGDFLGAGYQAYAGSNDRGELSDVRLTFEKQDARGRLLGPLHATSWSAGDVFTPGLAIGPRSQGGRGIAFSTGALAPASVFDRIDLRGELPIGSDAELYVNDVLRSGQRSPVQGRYEFLDVPLARGTNVIKIVTHGPKGERYEQTRVYNVGGGQLAAGESVLSFGIVDQTRSVFRLGSDGVTQDSVSGGDGIRAVASAAYGLTSRLTLTGGAGLYPVAGGEPRTLLTAGARTGVRSMAVQADGAVDDQGGAGVSVGLAGQPWGLSAVARHSEFRGGFQDEVVGTGDVVRELTRHSEFALDSSGLQLMGAAVPLSLRTEIRAFTDRSSSALASLRTSGSVVGLLVSGGLDHQIDSNFSGTGSRTTGVIGATRFVADGWHYRASVDYLLGGDPRFSAASFTADRDLTDDLAVRLGVGHGFGEGGETALQAGTIWRTEFGDLALNSEYSPERDDLKMGVRFAFGLAPGLGRSRYALSRPGAAASGSAVLEAFVDEDGDGRRGPKEPAVSGAVVEGGQRKVVTDHDGRALVTGLTGVNSRVQVTLDELVDVHLQAPPGTVEFPGRPGRVQKIAYPLTPTSEAVARVVAWRNGRLVGLSAVRVRLKAGDGKLTEGSTEFDGSVHFDALKAGQYQLELEPEQAARLRMRLKRPVHFTVRIGGGELDDLEAEVVFDPAPMQVATSEEKP